MTVDKNWMRVDVRGTYRVAHPDGIKGQSVLRDFHVKVKMAKSFLEHSYNLRGPFASYYEQILRKQFPGMINLYQTYLNEATELDGTVINHPKALSYENLIEYINQKGYSINIGLYDDQELRNQVVLYEKDKDGQQKLQGSKELISGSVLSISQALSEQDDLVMIIPTGGNEMPVTVPTRSKQVEAAEDDPIFGKPQRQKAKV